MKTRIYVGERLAGKFTCDGRKMTRFQAFVYKTSVMIKKIITVLAVIVIAGWISTGSYYYAKTSVKPVTVWAESIKEVPIKEITPVMTRIAKCESPTGHYKDGQVVINATKDAGKYQINLPVWSKKATSMGLNLMVEKDNEIFAQYLYENYGTTPWSASFKCWGI